MSHNESIRIGLIIADSNQKIVDELILEGINADVLVLDEKSLSDHCREVSAFMKDSKVYDLIHCIGSTIPLLFAGFIATPVLTTIVEPPSSSEIDLCTLAGRNCFFVSAYGNNELSSINLITDTCVPEKNSGTYYSTIYHRIIQSYSREDHRPWGFYEVLCDEHEGHKVKRITVWPGKRLSLQLHENRCEHWIVLSGQGRVTIGKDKIILGPSESADIPVGTVHRVENISNAPLVFIEVQQGDYLGEDDIIRLEDDFGRA